MHTTLGTLLVDKMRRELVTEAMNTNSYSTAILDEANRNWVSITTLSGILFPNVGNKRFFVESTDPVYQYPTNLGARIDYKYLLYAFMATMPQEDIDELIQSYLTATQDEEF